MNYFWEDNVVAALGESAGEWENRITWHREMAESADDRIEVSLLEMMAVAAGHLSRSYRQESGYLEHLARDVWRVSGDQMDEPWAGVNVLAGSVFAASVNLNDVLERLARHQQRLQGNYVRLLKAVIDLRKSRARPTSRRRSPTDPEEQ